MLYIDTFSGKWITRFSKANKMEDFQRDGEAPTLIPMMEQENYPMKMGIDPDLGCTVPVPVVLCMYYLSAVIAAVTKKGQNPSTAVILLNTN